MGVLSVREAREGGGGEQEGEVPGVEGEEGDSVWAWGL